MQCEAVHEYTLGQFLTAAQITWPTWAKWVRKGVAPKHYRIGMGRNIRIAAEEWSRWFKALEADRQRLGTPHLRHPVVRRSEERQRSSAPRRRIHVDADMLTEMLAQAVNKALVEVHEGGRQ